MHSVTVTLTFSMPSSLFIMAVKLIFDIGFRSTGSIVIPTIFGSDADTELIIKLKKTENYGNY